MLPRKANKIKTRQRAPKGWGVRYSLRGGPHRWLVVAVPVAAVTAYFTVRDGFSFGIVVFMTVFAALLGLFLEFIFRMRAYVAFHDGQMELSTYTWGEKGWARNNNSFIPYDSIASAFINSSWEI